MPDVIVHADTLRSPVLRYEVPLPVPDPFLYLEHDGRRVVVISSLEAGRVQAALPELEVFAPERFGRDELIRSGLDNEQIDLEIAVRVCRKLGIERASVPPDFPLELGDRLRAEGIEVAVDRPQPPA